MRKLKKKRKDWLMIAYQMLKRQRVKSLRQQNKKLIKEND